MFAIEHRIVRNFLMIFDIVSVIINDCFYGRKMETAVPYHPGLLLGRTVDMRTMQPGYMIIGEDVNPTELKVTIC